MSLLLLFKSSIRNQSCSGSVTPTGTLVKKTSRTVAGSSTATGSLFKRTSRALAGSVTAAGALVKALAKRLTGSVTASGTLSALKVIFKTLTGSCTPTGALVKQTRKALTGSVTSSGALARLTAKRLTGSVTAFGTLITNYLYGGINILLNGAAAAVRISGLTITDALNDAPNICTLRIQSPAPQTDQSLEVLVGQTPLFSGALQTVGMAYDLKGTNIVYPCTAIDDTNKANMKRPFGSWTNVSATTVGNSLVADFAPDFDDSGIVADLPEVTITFDGSETFIACFARMAKLIGGYCKVEEDVVYLFLTDVTDLPDDITDANLPLNDPPITRTVDASQLRTRVYGKGYGENVPTDISAGETIIPIIDGTSFTPTGGLAITGLTADGAQSQRIAYAGVALGGGGTLVGPGAQPTTGPAVVLAGGSGVESGIHNYSQVWVTAAGKSLPSPVSTISVGTLPAPTSAPVAAVPSAGGNVDAGDHDYYITYVTAAGETTVSPASNVITTVTGVGATTPVTAGGVYNGSAPPSAGGSMPDGAYVYRSTYTTAIGETEGTAWGLGFFVVTPNSSCNVGLTASTDPRVTGINIYRSLWGGPYYLKASVPNVSGSYLDTTGTVGGTTIPTVNTTAVPGTNYQTVVLTGLPVPASPMVTAKKLYRGGYLGALYLATIAVGTTTYTDTTPNSSLGAVAPSTNTAVGNQVSYARIAGPTGTTAREYYRTVAGGSALKLLATLADNSTLTNGTDSTPDASLGAAAPTSDTSGLTQPSGQVNAGSTTLILASPTPFSVGWVILSGGQVVRYTGVSGNLLTGIPSTGPGSISTAILYGSQALPCPALTGVTGVVAAIAKGSSVNIWVQRDDPAGQAAEIVRSGGGDGIVEYMISDERRVEASLIALCDANLALFSFPIVTVRYACRDIKTKSGKQITFNLTAPFINDTLTIQSVTIDQIGIAQGLRPRFTATASSVRFSFEDTLRRLVSASTAR